MGGNYPNVKNTASTREIAQAVNHLLNGNYAGLTNAADDTAAADAGVKIGDLYRNGSQVCVRVS